MHTYDVFKNGGDTHRTPAIDSDNREEQDRPKNRELSPGWYSASLEISGRIPGIMGCEFSGMGALP